MIYVEKQISGVMVDKESMVEHVTDDIFEVINIILSRDAAERGKRVTGTVFGNKNGVRLGSNNDLGTVYYISKGGTK